MEYEFKELFNRLNKVCRESYNSAAHSCQTKKHYSIELEDFLLKLLDQSDTDIYQVLRYYEIDRQSLIRQLESTIATKKRAPDAFPIVSPQVYELLSQAWLISSLMLKEGQIRSGSIILALVNRDSFRGLLLEKCTLLLRIPRQVLLNDLAHIIRTSEEKCLTPAHLQVVTATTTTNDSTKQHDLKQFKDSIKTFTPKPDETAYTSYIDLYSDINQITNDKTLNNIFLIDTPDINFDKFLAGAVHHINIIKKGSCEVKLLRLARESQSRRDAALLNLLKNTTDISKAYLYAIDSVDFSEHVFDQIKDICSSNKVRFIFHDALNNYAKSPWLSNYLIPIVYKFENDSTVKNFFIEKLKLYENKKKVSLEADTINWLYKLASQYTKGDYWQVGEQLLQEAINTETPDNISVPQLSLYPNSVNLKSNIQKSIEKKNTRIVTKHDILRAAKSTLNKFIDFDLLDNLTEIYMQEKLNLNDKFAVDLSKTITENSEASSAKSFLALLYGGDHANRFYNAQKAVTLMSLGHQRITVLSQTDNYADCSLEIIETTMRYRTAYFFINFDTISPQVLINLIQDIEAGYISHSGMNFSLRTSRFYFSSSYHIRSKHNSDKEDDVSIANVIKQYAGPWVNQHLREYNFDTADSEIRNIKPTQNYDISKN